MHRPQVQVIACKHALVLHGFQLDAPKMPETQIRWLTLGSSNTVKFPDLIDFT